jgi:dTDP-4-amino-4,6-dideoxygalactose transaminase
MDRCPTRQRRRSLAKLLSDVDEIVMPADSPRARSVYHTFVVQAQNRDPLRAFLADHKIESIVHYSVPIHLSSGAQHLGYVRGDFRATERQAQTILTLPVHDKLRGDEIERVPAGIRAFYRG